MGVLIRLLLSLGWWAIVPAWAGPYDIKTQEQIEIEKALERLCPSTQEFIKTLKFLREAKDYQFQEEASRGIALQVAAGCAGSSERFAQILTLLKTTGFSEKKALDMALEFAATSPDVQKNFLEIFSKSFLREFFDYEFSKALQIALELSRDYKGDPARAREDFIELAQFCKKSESLGLPMNFCSEYAVQTARLSQYFPQGIAKEFLPLFKKLRDSRKFGLNIKTSLEIAHNILKSGPRGPENFFAAYDFAVDDFRFDKKKALEFALNLADRSFIGATPPVLQTRDVNIEDK